MTFGEFPVMVGTRHLTFPLDDNDDFEETSNRAEKFMIDGSVEIRRLRLLNSMPATDFLSVWDLRERLGESDEICDMIMMGGLDHRQIDHLKLKCMISTNFESKKINIQSNSPNCKPCIKNKTYSKNATFLSVKLSLTARAR